MVYSGWPCVPRVPCADHCCLLYQEGKQFQLIGVETPKPTVAKQQELLFEPAVELPPLVGIDLNLPKQQALLKKLATHYPKLTFPEKPVKKGTPRYYYQNDRFSYCDGIFLFSMLHCFRPHRVFEVGAGPSSAIIAEFNQKVRHELVDYQIIDPESSSLKRLQGHYKESYQYHQTTVRKIPLESFEQLQANDILLVHCDEILNHESDLYHLLFKVIPQLAPGVLIQLRHVGWDFKGTEEDAGENAAVGNNYMFIKAFLQFNTAFEIVIHNELLVRLYPRFFEEKMPLCLQNSGNSLWIRKI